MSDLRHLFSRRDPPNLKAVPDRPAVEAVLRSWYRGLPEHGFERFAEDQKENAVLALDAALPFLPGVRLSEAEAKAWKEGLIGVSGAGAIHELRRRVEHLEAELARISGCSVSKVSSVPNTGDLARAQGLAEAIRDRTYSTTGEGVAGVAGEIVELIEGALAGLSNNR